MKQLKQEVVADAVVDELFCKQTIHLERVRRRRYYQMKRAIDIAGSLTALISLSPLFALISILIRLTSGGPVLFRQTRLGQFGAEFTFLKFRSMYVDNDAAIHKEYVQNLINGKTRDSGGAYKITNDPRVTRLGRLLRKSSLDELPQFINVLKGEMSLVGPRPPIHYEFENYAPWHRLRLEAKPGITGEWQVNGRSRTTFDEMILMDLHYIGNQSLWTDLKILLKTPLAVIGGNGAY
jgi:lipopolysaccharide/colanic/teichoic acid biosynthesis glycosyltransferase